MLKRNPYRRLLLVSVLWVICLPAKATITSGTIFLDPDIITSADPTTYTGSTYVGRGFRTMYDRRVPGWVSLNAYLFDASYHDGFTLEVQVNPEFGSASNAWVEADFYADAIGRIPRQLRMDAQTVWIHRGVEGFGGGNNNFLIHTGQGSNYVASGILEETLVHEGCHTSVDHYHAATPGWLAAQTSDGDFISTYARDYPTREDIAETFLVWLAVRHRADRISASLANSIINETPNRLAYFDDQNFDLYPVVSDNDADTLPDVWEFANNLNHRSATGLDGPGGDPDGDDMTNYGEFLAGTDPFNSRSFFGLSAQPVLADVQLTWPSVPGKRYKIHISHDMISWSPFTDGEGDQIFDASAGASTSYLMTRQGALGYMRIEVLP